jgi:hypothetical protein
MLTAQFGVPGARGKVIRMKSQAYPDEMSLLDARALFFKRSELGVDGGYSSRWVRVEAPIPLAFPNWEGRVAAARQHDLHHIALDYRTDWPGEVEIAAWEIASGCRRYFAAWLLDLGGMNVGMMIAPRRMFRAFVRGRRAKTNLYKHPLTESQLANVTLGALRCELEQKPVERTVTATDTALFASACAAALLVFEVAPLVAAMCVRRILR